MRFLATMILTSALALPALAQPGRDGFGGRPGGEGKNPQAEVEKLKQTVKELEAKLKAGKEGEKEKDKKKDDKKPEPKKEEAKKPEPQRGESRGEQRGEGFRGQQPMGDFQGRGGFGGPMGGFGGGMNFPGMSNLTPEEQATFKKLTAKMTGQRQPDRQLEGRKPESKQPDRQPEGRKPDLKQPDRQLEGRKPDLKQPDRKPEAPSTKGPAPKQPNLEERLERLEKMMLELMRSQRGR